MNATPPSVTVKALTFIAITFAVSWGVTVGSWLTLPRENVLITYATLVLMMTGPAIAALICVFMFERGDRREKLGVKWTPNMWWFIAWLTPIVIAIGSVVLTILIGGREFVQPGAAALAMAQAQSADVPTPNIPVEALSAIIIVQAAVLGGLLNGVIITFTEELGWRGYLYALWRPFGFWRFTLASGAIWGVWHAPAILLFGHNYPDNRLLGVGLFTAFCMLLSVIMTLVRDKGRSVAAAGIAHGSLNAVAMVSILTVSEPHFPWNGMLGIGGFVALAIGALIAALYARTANH